MRHTYTVIKLIIFILFTGISLMGYAQVGPVGARDTMSIDPSNITQEDLPTFENQLREELRRTNQFSDWDNLDRQVSGETDEEGNTLLNQQKKRRMLGEAALASELVMQMTERGSAPLREDLDTVDVFGFSVLRSKGEKLYNSATDAKAPDNYVIGVGDQIQVVVWGVTDYNEMFIVDKEGYIQPRYVGRIYIKGLTLAAARDAITAGLRRSYNLSGSQVEVTLNYSRVITVHVVGDVENPGSFTFPAVNTVFNLLSHIGGPTKTGTLRNIQLKRGGKVVATFDLYKYLFAPEQVGDIFLENNDYIYVPTAGNIVIIEGDITRPGKYEMLPNESVNDLVRYAGGFSAGAFQGSVQIRRFENNRMIVTDVPGSQFSSFQLQRGDVVTVRQIAQQPRNYVRIHGPVYVPGMYEARPGLRVMDLVDAAQGLLPEVYTAEAYIIRVNDDFTRTTIKINLANAIRDRNSPDNVELTSRDEVVIFSRNQFYDAFGVSISGAVRNPQTFPLLFGMSLRDLILMAGGLSETALIEKAVIYRTLPNLEEEAIYVSLDTSNNLMALDTIFLESRDKVRIFSKTAYLDGYTIKVHGAVRNPGTQPYRRNMTVAEAVLASGDVTISALGSRIEVTRIINFDSAGTNNATVNVATIQVTGSIANDGQANSFVLQPYDEVFVRDIPNFRYQQTVVLAGEVNYPGTYSLISKDETLTSLIQRAGGLTSFAYPRGATMIRRNDPDKGLVIMNLEEAMRRKKSRYNYILRNGDSIFIPITLDFVTLKGALEHPDIKMYGAVNAPYIEGKSAKFYIKHYGTGFSERAQRKRTLVTYPNGEVHNPDFVFFGRKYPVVEKGSEIYVPEKGYMTRKEARRNRAPKEKADREKVIQTVVSSITSLATMLLLVINAVK